MGSNETSFAFSGIFVVSLLGSWKAKYVKKRQTALMAGDRAISEHRIAGALPCPSGFWCVGLL